MRIEGRKGASMRSVTRPLGTQVLVDLKSLYLA